MSQILGRGNTQTIQDTPQQADGAMPAPAGFSRLFDPQSVAIIGASNEPDKLAGLPLKFLKAAGYAGTVWPVNPNREAVQGLRSYACVSDLPGIPDVAIIVVPVALVRQAVIDCAQRGVPFAMIFTSGFGETGDDRIQAELVTIARAAGMRLLGPNCLGCFNSESGFYGTFAIALNAGLHAPGNVAMVSQSGAYGEQTCYLARERGIAMRYFASTGNEADIGIGEVIEWLADQREIEVILAYAEGLRDPASLEAGLARARVHGKRVIFVKVGRSAAGAAAAASHTAALASADAVWDAVFEKYGVYRARSTEEQVDIAYAASRGTLPTGRQLGIFSLSGGFGIQLCDAATEMGLGLPPLPGPVAKSIGSLLPFGSIHNPLDASGQATSSPSRLGESLRLFVNDAGFDAVIGFFGTIPLVPAIGVPLQESITALGSTLADKLVVLSLVGPAETVRAYEDAGFLVFPDTYRAVRSIAALAALGGHTAIATGPAPPQERCHQPAPALSEHRAKARLAEAGIPVLPERLVLSPEEASASARELGLPVALKICGAAIPHKSDIGGVLLALDSEAAVAEGYSLLMHRAAAAGYTSEQIDGVLVMPMARRGVETILGVKNDPTFGPVVLFGLGGIFSEVFKDFAVRVAPVDMANARQMIGAIAASPILEGARGMPKADIDALACAISALSHFAVANVETIAEIDINPFVVWPENEGGVALDALITLKADQAGATGAL